MTTRSGGRRSITSRASLPPFQQDVPIEFGRLRNPRSVERLHNLILSLGGEDAEPFRAFGPIHRDGSLFVFGGEPDYDEQIRDEDIAGEPLIRVKMKLKLMVYQRPDRVKERKRRRKRRRGTGRIAAAVAVGGTYTTREGDTLQTIAADLFNGDWKRWGEIGEKNRITDPNRKLPAGRVLKI